MFKILTSTASADSAMKLRDAIEQVLGLKPKTILVSKNSDNCQQDTILLRYGCQYGSVRNEPEWNSQDFIRTCIDKLKFSQLFSGKILVPEFYSGSFPTEFPVLIRETLTGKESQGIHVVHTANEFLAVWQPGFYWTKFYKAEFELRVQVVLSEEEFALRIYKKVPREEVTEEDFVVAGDNCAWKLRNTENYPKVEAIVKKMAQTIWQMGGRFMGMDMIYVPEIKDYVVLEINSGPWLTKTSAAWLAELFVKHQWRKFQ